MLLAGAMDCAARDAGRLDASDGGGDAATGVEPGDSLGARRPPPTGLPAASACVTDAPGPRALRRLTAEQFAESVRDLFRDADVPVSSIFNDPIVLGFSADASALVVKDLTSQQLLNYAESVASWAVANHLSALAGCTTMDAACAREFVRGFGKRVFRAPLTVAEAERYDALFAAEASFADGMEAVISAMLQSPNFLYRRELGAPDAAHPGRYALTSYEVASALSYWLIGTTPDDELLAAADAGNLSSGPALDAQAQRLLEDPRSRDALMRFMTGWLGFGRVMTAVKDDTTFHLTDSLRQDMMAETRALVVDTVFTKNGTLADMLTAPYSFLSGDLARHYGLDTIAGTGPAMVTYAAGQRDPGILAHASFLTGFATASTSSPVQRGRLVRTRLLCQDLPPPPADLDTKLDPRGPTETTRQHYEQHAASAVCASCHHLIDPVGYGFELYDGFGRRRELENGRPVDDTGTLREVREGDVPFKGIAELASYLSASNDVKGCMLRYVSYYAFGRASWAEDGCTYDALRREAQQSDFKMQSVVLSIVHAPHFANRVMDP
jgi:hypothetical protein